MIGRATHPHRSPVVDVHLPAALREVANGQRVVQVGARSVGEMLLRLSTDYPALAPALMKPNGLPHRFVKIYVNEHDVQLARGLDTPLTTLDQIFILSAVIGD